MSECRGLNVADAVSRRVNFVGLVHPTPLRETEALREGEGMKASHIQGLTKISKYIPVGTSSEAFFPEIPTAGQETNGIPAHEFSHFLHPNRSQL